MKTRIFAFTLAALVVATAFGANTTLKTANAQGPNNNQGAPQSIIGPNGKLLKKFLSVNCTNQTSGETQKERGWQKDKTGKDVIGDVNVTSQLTMDCPTSPVSSSGLATTALVSWQSWRCYGQSEYDTLLGMNYKIAMSQYFQTSPYTNIVWAPPAVQVTASSGLGWHVDSVNGSGPFPWSYFSAGIVASGFDQGAAQYSYPIVGGWNLATANKTIALVFSYGRCTWYK